MPPGWRRARGNVERAGWADLKVYMLAVCVELLAWAGA